MSNSGLLFRRYVWLVETVSGQSLTREEISDKWERSSLNDGGGPLPKKTFYNHIDAIEEVFGLRIRCRQHGGRTYFIENRDDIENAGGLYRWLINTMSLSNALSENRELRGRILYEDIPSGQEHLLAVLEAMKENKTLTITYEGFLGNGRATFPVNPYFVKVFRRRWYMIGLSTNLNQMRVYALDRIIDMDILDGSTFVMPADFSPETYFADCFGIIRDDSVKVEKVRIKVFGHEAKYIESLPLHSSQKVIGRKSGEDEENSWTQFEYRLRPTYDFVQEVLSHGSKVMVESPESLRKRIYEEVDVMKDNHHSHEDWLKEYDDWKEFFDEE